LSVGAIMQIAYPWFRRDQAGNNQQHEDDEAACEQVKLAVIWAFSCHRAITEQIVSEFFALNEEILNTFSGQLTSFTFARNRTGNFRYLNSKSK
jgi:hypothetical protein